MGKITNNIQSGAWQTIHVCRLDSFDDAVLFIKNDFDPGKHPPYNPRVSALKKGESVTFTGDPWVVFYFVQDPVGVILFSLTKCIGNVPNVNISFSGSQFLLSGQ